MFKRNIYIENHPMEKALELYMNRLEKAGFFQPEVENIAVREALGRISGGPVFARRSSPHYTASAMDGIAVAAMDTVPASELKPVLLTPGQYLEVDTGDYIPRQFDAVIMIEDVNFSAEGARIIKPAVPWQHIRSVGEDLVAHDMIVPGSFPLGPYEIAAFLNAALDSIPVIKRPVVAIIPTGSELIEKGSLEMKPGEIVETNSYMLAGLCEQWGARAVRHAIVPDDRILLSAALQEMTREADLVVICSGSSAGREDYTADLISERGKVLVHGLATRPGKPAILGMIDNKPVIGVPGYPVSAQLIFTLFARPILYRKQGLPLPVSEQITAHMTRKTASHMGVDEYLYVSLAKIKERFIAYPLSRGAGITTSLVKADGVALIPRGQEGMQAGEACSVTLMRSRQFIDRTLVAIGSHDPSLDFLTDLLRRKYNMRMISTNAGSMGGLMALMREEAHFAGIHLLDLETGEYNLSYLDRYLKGRPWLLVNLATREQGFIVKKGNPMGIRGLEDLMRPEVRYINRQKGSGTRILLDYLLNRESLAATGINGYSREEYTHLAVAAAVKNDACDVGLGIFASARAMDLDFIPVADEIYDLCLLPDLMETSQMEALMEIINNRDFHRLLFSSGGYGLKMSGMVRASRGINP